MSAWNHRLMATYPEWRAERTVNDGERLAVELTQMGIEDDVPYGTVHEMLVDQMDSNADYGILAAAMLEYHDDDSIADDLRNAIERALEDYIDREWYRLCGVQMNGECDPSKADDRFVR